MGFGAIKRTPLDILFSKYLRIRSKGICARCKHFFDWKYQMEVSHFKGRRSKSGRWNEDNVDPTCKGCHRFFEENPHEYVEWKKKQLGEERYDKLILRLNLPSKGLNKVDESMLKLYYKKKLEEIEDI
jgi:hypothetical protein